MFILPVYLVLRGGSVLGFREIGKRVSPKGWVSAFFLETNPKLEFLPVSV